MASLMKIHKEWFTYHVFEKSIQVCSVDTAQMVFFGREVGEKDVDTLHHLVKMGTESQARLIRDVLTDSPLG